MRFLARTARSRSWGSFMYLESAVSFIKFCILLLPTRSERPLTMVSVQCLRVGTVAITVRMLWTEASCSLLFPTCLAEALEAEGNDASDYDTGGPRANYGVFDDMLRNYQLGLFVEAVRQQG